MMAALYGVCIGVVGAGFGVGIFAATFAFLERRRR